MDDLKLVTVLETDNSFALILAKASLDEAGIPYVVQGEESFPQYFGMRPQVVPGGVFRLQVATEFERRAHELVEPLRR